MNLRGVLTSPVAGVICFLSAVFNVAAILGLIVALVKIRNSTIAAALLATVVSCVYLTLPGWYLARALRVYAVPRNRFADILLKALRVISALFIVLVAMGLLGVVGAHDADFRGASIFIAFGIVGVFAFLPIWYFLHLLFGDKQR